MNEQRPAPAPPTNTITTSPSRADLSRRDRTLEAIQAVVSDTDLVALILWGSIGPSSFNAASLVCKAWLSVCRADECVLRSVALYTGALTKGVLMQLLAVTSRHADTLPRESYARLNGGICFLYRKAAIDQILAAGGLSAWRERVRMRGANQGSVKPAYPSYPRLACSTRLVSQQEERLHVRAVRVAYARAVT